MEFAALMAVEQIDEAVIVFRDEDDHARAMARPGQTPLHGEGLGDRGKVSGEVGQIGLREVDVKIFRIELHAHQKEAGLFIGMFVSMENVSVVPVDEVGDGRDFALAVGAGD